MKAITAKDAYFIYLVTDRNFNYKIGIANNPLRRLKEFNTASPVKLTLLFTFYAGNKQDAFILEQKLHSDLGLSRKRNGEWFKLSRFDLKVLAVACSENISFKETLTLSFKKNEDKKKSTIITDSQIFDKAKDIIFLEKKASVSLLQRKLSIGYVRAARIIDMLEEKGLIGKSRGALSREVFFISELV